MTFILVPKKKKNLKMVMELFLLNIRKVILLLEKLNKQNFLL